MLSRVENIVTNLFKEAGTISWQVYSGVICEAKPMKMYIFEYVVEFMEADGK